MGAGLNDLSVFHDVDGVAFFNCGQAMGNDDEGGILLQGVQSGFDRVLCDGIQITCGFVHDNDIGIFKECSCDGKPLSLTAGEIGTVFVQTGFVFHGQLVDEIMCSAHCAGADEIVVCSIGIGQTQVFCNGTAEQEGVLRNIGNAISEHFDGNFADILTANGNGT